MDNVILSHDPRHYDSETGAWDGQLPHPDIAQGAGPAGGRDSSAGTPLDRWQWVFDAVQHQKLNGTQGLVLSRIVFRAGPPTHRCSESQKSIARSLALNEDTVRRAVRDLEKKGLVAYERRFNPYLTASSWSCHLA